MKHLILTIVLALASVANSAAQERVFGRWVQGGWITQFTVTHNSVGIPAGYQFPAFLLFHFGGTMSGGDNDPTDGPAYGVWTQDYNGDCVLTFYGFQFDPVKGAVAVEKIRARLTVDSDGRTAKGTWDLDLSDFTGKPLGNISGTLTLTRMQLEAPPQ